MTVMVLISSAMLGFRSGAQDLQNNPKVAWKNPLASATEPAAYLSPSAMVTIPGGKEIWIACATAGQVLVFDPVSGSVTDRVAVPASPLGLVASKESAVV